MQQVSNCISLIGVAIKYPNLRKIILGFVVEIILHMPLYEIVVPHLCEN